MLTGEAAATSAALDGAEGRTNDGELAPEAILVEQVRLLHDNALLSQLVALFNAGILCLVQWSMVDHGIILAWLACIGVVSLLRLAQSRAFGRVNPSAATIGIWRNRFLVGVGASGTLWGAAGVLFFPHQSLPHQVFTSFVVAGMVAGSVATLSPLLSAFVLFLLPALAPIVLQFLLPGGELYFPMSLMAVLYGLGMLAVAKNVNRILRTSLSLSHANGELVRVLTQAKSRVDSLNRSLQAEVSERQVKEEALRDSESRLAEAQRMAHLGSWSYDVANHVAFWSAETFRIYGLDPSSTVPSCKELLQHMHRADRKRVQRMIERALDEGRIYETDLRVLTPAGELRWVHALWQPQAGADGKTSYLRGTVLDITERKLQEQQLESEHRVLRSIATGRALPEVLELLCHTVEEQMGTAVCSVLLLDDDGIHLRDAAGPSLPRGYRHAVDSVTIGPRAGSCGTAAYLNRQVIVSDIEHDPLWVQYREVALAHGLRACWSTPVSGTSRPVLGTFAIYFRESRTPTPKEKSVIARASNIVKIAIERDEAERRIRQLAHFDELTSLPNRAMFNQSLDHALRQAERSKTSLALLFVDLDRFKNINDTLGHEAGDRLLREVAARLRGCLRDSDMVARFGGDEFMVLLEDLADARFAGTVAEKLLEALARPLVLDGQEFHVTGSIGISTFPEDASDVQSLQKNADIAMYRAKERGSGNYGYYSPQANAHSLEQLTMEGQLRHAVERGELVLHYQPKQDIRTGRVTGVEALVRWQHPELGMIPPMRFIPLAEETGLIVPIGEWVLQTACTEIQRLCESPTIGPLRVAVNLSARQLADDRLVEVVTRTLEDSGLDVSCLELEITESMVMHNADHAVRLLTRLKEMGVHLAMDDFGTGYSSLAYLKRFPVDSIKIDRSFIQGVPGDADGSTLTQAIVAMAHSLRLRTIAEGVENEQQLEFLRDHGCDEMQGYFFSRPLPLDQLVDLLRVHAERQASGPAAAARRSLAQFWP